MVQTSEMWVGHDACFRFEAKAARQTRSGDASGNQRLARRGERQGTSLEPAMKDPEKEVLFQPISRVGKATTPECRDQTVTVVRIIQRYSDRAAEVGERLIEFGLFAGEQSRG
jgi:hypothetical protein